MSEETRQEGASWGRWLIPSLGLVLFAFHLGLTRADPGLPLRDPGMGWHLKVGEWMWQQGRLPEVDLFSWTQPESHWTTYQWLFQVVLGWAQEVGGIPLVVVLSGVLFGLVPVFIYRQSVRMGANALIAFGVCLPMYLLLLGHWAARPHLVTYACFALLLGVLNAIEAGRGGWGSVGWAGALMVLWVNMHGGWVAGLVLAGVYGGVAAAEWAWSKDPEAGRRAAGYGAVLAALVVASCVNPWGLGLHLAVFQFLKLESVRYQVEFLSPDFAGGGAIMLGAEVVLLGLVAVLARSRKPMRWVEVASLVTFLHFGLQSRRHLILAGIVAVPLVARHLTELWLGARTGGMWERVDALQRPLRSEWLYVPVLSALLIGECLWSDRYPRDLAGHNLTVGAAEFIARSPERFERMFNTDDLGGALIYRFWPQLRVFCDDRNDYYQDRFTFEAVRPLQFGEGLEGATEWNAILAEWGVSSAVVSKHHPAWMLFELSPDWTRLYDDERVALFERVK